MANPAKKSAPRALPENDPERFELRLYVTGASPNSLKAITNIRKICEDHLPGRYTLDIIDVYRRGDIAQEEQLVALPLLVKKHPMPERKLVGDLSGTEKVLRGLGIIVD